MEITTQRFRETNLLLQLIKESQIEDETMMSWGSRGKRVHFCNVCILSQCIEY